MNIIAGQVTNGLEYICVHLMLMGSAVVTRN